MNNQEALKVITNIMNYYVGSNENVEAVKIIQELVYKHKKIKEALNKAISERINATGKVLERDEIAYIQALQFALKLLEMSE